MKKNNCTQYHIKTRYQEIDDGGCITARFSARAEAKSFLGLILNGKSTVAEAKESILMTGRQLGILQAEYPMSSKLLAAIHRKRLQTWRELQGMLLAAKKPARLAA